MEHPKIFSSPLIHIKLQEKKLDLHAYTPTYTEEITFLQVLLAL